MCSKKESFGVHVFVHKEICVCPKPAHVGLVLIGPRTCLCLHFRGLAIFLFCGVPLPLSCFSSIFELHLCFIGFTTLILCSYNRLSFSFLSSLEGSPQNRCLREPWSLCPRHSQMSPIIAVCLLFLLSLSIVEQLLMVTPCWSPLLLSTPSMPAASDLTPSGAPPTLAIHVTCKCYHNVYSSPKAPNFLSFCSGLTCAYFGKSWCSFVWFTMFTLPSL